GRTKHEIEGFQRGCFPSIRFHGCWEACSNQAGLLHVGEMPPTFASCFLTKLEEERMDILDIFHDAGLGYWYLVSSGLCWIFWLLWDFSKFLALPSSPKLPLLDLSMGLVNVRNHSYHNSLSKPHAFAWFGPT
ncbi:unnamed protein product, partial [Prunus brigantina]